MLSSCLPQLQPAGSAHARLRARAPTRAAACALRTGGTRHGSGPVLAVFQRTEAKLSGGGAGVLQKPSFMSEVVVVNEKKLAPQYKVLLHDDNVNKRDYVVKCLLKCIEGMTHERAFEIMDEADMHGLALVKVEAQEEAEEHCEKLRGNGLISSVEPAD